MQDRFNYFMIELKAVILAFMVFTLLENLPASSLATLASVLQNAALSSVHISHLLETERMTSTVFIVQKLSLQFQVLLGKAYSLAFSLADLDASSLARQSSFWTIEVMERDLD
jgi:hypothetical protein